MNATLSAFISHLVEQSQRKQSNYHILTQNMKWLSALILEIEILAFPVLILSYHLRKVDVIFSKPTGSSYVIVSNTSDNGEALRLTQEGEFEGFYDRDGCFDIVRLKRGNSYHIVCSDVKSEALRIDFLSD